MAPKFEQESFSFHDHTLLNNKKKYNSVLLYHEKGRDGYSRGVFCPFSVKTLNHLSTDVTPLPDLIYPITDFKIAKQINPKIQASTWTIHCGPSKSIVIDRLEDEIGRVNEVNEIKIKVAKVFLGTTGQVITHLVNWSSIYDFNLGKRGRVTTITKTYAPKGIFHAGGFVAEGLAEGSD